MSALAGVLSAGMQLSSELPSLPYSVIGSADQKVVTAEGALQLLLGLELESIHARTHVYKLSGKYAEAQPVIKALQKRADAKFTILSGFYTVQDPAAVQDFLADRKPLFDLLFAALPRVKQTWGSDAKTVLELLHDPEDDSSSLVVHVLSNHPNRYEALDQFDEQWWLSHAGESEGRLNFSVEP